MASKFKSVEQSFRDFVRAQFKAKLIKNDDGEFAVARGHSVKAEIANPDVVLEALSERCKVLRRTKRGVVFAYKTSKAEGGVKAEINVSRVMGHDYLTMTTEH